MKCSSNISGNGKKRETKAYELSHLNLLHFFVNDSESLCESEFRFSVHCDFHYVSEQKATTGLKAAEAANDFVLTHEGNLG